MISIDSWTESLNDKEIVYNVRIVMLGERDWLVFEFFFFCFHLINYKIYIEKNPIFPIWKCMQLILF